MLLITNHVETETKIHKLWQTHLTLKEPFTEEADNILEYFFPEKNSRENNGLISCESSVMQMIHMKCQALFWLKSDIFQNVIGLILNATLRVKMTSVGK